MGALKNPKFVLPTMSHSGGTITATFSNGSSLSRLISADVTLVANTLYMVYLVTSGGTAALRISTNVNSVGPAGFTTWTLVGAFYANGLSSVAFGAFVNIVGTPVSGLIPYLPTFNGSPSVDSVDFKWMRDSLHSKITGSVRLLSAPASDSAFSLPTGQAWDTASVAGASRQNKVGSGRKATAAGGVSGFQNFNSSYTFNYNSTYPSSIFVSGSTQGDGGANLGQVGWNGNFVANERLFIDECRVPVFGWSNTPLVDL